jgi:Na+/alanine symporter
MNMNWLGKVRPQVAIAMVFLGTAMIYAIMNDAFELASAFGGFIAMLAKEVIASDD